jgi:AraC-like DNA-binding protein
MKICRLFSNLDPYRQLEPEQLSAISRTYKKTSIPAGAFLVRQGQPVSQIGFILSGTAKVTVIDHNGEEWPCGLLDEGDLLFDIAVLTGDHATANIVSLKSSTWFLQSRESFLHTIDCYRSLKDYFYRKMAMGVRWGHEIFCKDFLPGFCDDRGENFRLPFLQKALQFIHDNYHRQITLEMVARETAMSKYHFSRLFKQHMGLSFKQYLNRQRVEAAKSLIATSGYNITEASFAVGFNDASYFSRVFREIEGGPPKRLLSLSDSTVSKAG